MGRLSGKTAIVTGAAGGLGYAIAQAFVNEGATVALLDNNGVLVREAASGLAGERGHAYVCDVTDRAAVKAAVDDFANKVGGLDILVNNAVYFSYALLTEMSEEVVDRMIDVGLKGSLWALQAATPHLVARGGGSVINLSSIAVSFSIRNAAVYTAIKGAIDALTRQQAVEIGAHGIRVNALAPGPVATPGANSVITEEGWEARRQRAPLGRLTTPAEVAAAAVFLASDDAFSIAGVTLKIDSGITIAGPESNNAQRLSPSTSTPSSPLHRADHQAASISHADPRGTGGAAAQLVEDALTQTGGGFDPKWLRRAQACLLDYLSCAFEALPLQWSEQAAGLAVAQSSKGAHIVGRQGQYAMADAAFANAVSGHGLVREDMHAGSVAHLGVVVWPTLLALAEKQVVSGRDLLVAAIVGYETGAQIGRAVMTEALGRLFRPTGLVGPFAATMAGAHFLKLDEARALNAFALAGNCSAGLNEWPHTGGSEMYFHPGFAVRNALTCLGLAEQGASGSASILDGEAGFFAAYARAPLSVELRLFKGERPEIMSVFNKAVPACNFAQSPCQAALAIANRLEGRSVSAVRIETTRAAVNYPGCAAQGPFERALQAKMSIPFGVAATLVCGTIAEANYARLDDPDIRRLLMATTLAPDADYSAAFPARQGARVIVLLSDGTELSEAMDDVVAADDALIRRRFIDAATSVLGAEAAQRIAHFVDHILDEPDAGELARLCALRVQPIKHSEGGAAQ